MSTVKIKKFTIDNYQQLIKIGFFPVGERIELIKGEIIEMAAKGIAHETCLRKLLKQLFSLVGEQAIIQCQSPILIPPDSQPEPDFALLKNRDDCYSSNHPQVEDILLVIEVADSSIAYDQQIKLDLYARAGIEHYWIFNLLDNWLEIYQQPLQINSEKFNYAFKKIILPQQTVNLPFLIDTYLDLTQILPQITTN